ncbi:MAG: hypothetical protein M1831_007306 [Alyxoria varia]|nr:MAG: hypothetical protein M1831_007306 [Alyxoria varia]
MAAASSRRPTLRVYDSTGSVSSRSHSSVSSLDGFEKTILPFPAFLSSVAPVPAASPQPRPHRSSESISLPFKKHLPPNPSKASRASSVYSRKSVLSNGDFLEHEAMPERSQSPSLFTHPVAAYHSTSHLPDCRPSTPPLPQATRYHSLSRSRNSSRQFSATDYRIKPFHPWSDARSTPKLTFFDNGPNDDSGMSINIANLPPLEACRDASSNSAFANAYISSRDPSALDVPLLRSASTYSDGGMDEPMGPEEAFDDRLDDQINGNRALVSHSTFSTHLSELSNASRSSTPSPSRGMRTQYDETTSHRSYASDSSASALSAIPQSRQSQSTNPHHSLFPPPYHDILLARAREEAPASTTTDPHIREHMRLVPAPLRPKKSMNLHKRSKSGEDDGPGKSPMKKSQSQPSSPTERFMAALPIRKMSLRHRRHRSEETKGTTREGFEDRKRGSATQTQRNEGAATGNARVLHESNGEGIQPASTSKSTHTKNPSTSSNKSTRKKSVTASPTKLKKSPTTRSPILAAFFPLKSPTHTSAKSPTSPETPPARPRPAPEPEKLQQLGDALGKARQELAAVRSGNIDNAISLASNDATSPTAYSRSVAPIPTRGTSFREKRGTDSPAKLQKKVQHDGKSSGDAPGIGTGNAGQEGKLTRSKSLLGRKTRGKSDEMRRELEREKLKRSIRVVGIEDQEVISGLRSVRR